MTSRRTSSLTHWLSFGLVFSLLMPATAFATHFELSRLASQIESISAQLAHELRYTRHYGSVRQRAVTLRREAGQLVESLRRNRSNSRIRSQFKDVRRGYERFEAAFFQADRRSHDPYIYQDVAVLSDLFSNLSEQYYYAGFSNPSYGRVYNAPYIGSSSRYYPNVVPRNNQRRYGRNDHDRARPNRGNGYRGNSNSRSNNRIVPSRERAVPPVFRGNSGRIEGNRGERTRSPRVRGEGRTPRARAQGANNFDHRSPVLERQARQEGQRRQAEARGRQNRSAVGGGRSSRSETRRRNHYE